MNRGRTQKSGFLLFIIISINMLSGDAFAQSSGDDDIHISAIAEFFAIHRYPKQEGHMANAVGPGGYWEYAFSEPSTQAANKAALADCTANLRTSPYKSLARRKCVLFDIDGNRTGKAAPIGIPFGTASTCRVRSQ